MRNLWTRLWLWWNRSENESVSQIAEWHENWNKLGQHSLTYYHSNDINTTRAGHNTHDENRYVVEDRSAANLVTSLVVPSEVFDPPMHCPLLDIDGIPVRLVQSASGKNWHLYIGKAMPWSQYVKLLQVLVECGIVSPKYVGHSIQRGHTALRPPWVPKLMVGNGLDSSDA